MLISEHGKPSAYLVDGNDYEFLKNRLAILDGIECGERAIDGGIVVSHQAAKAKMFKWLK